MRVYTTVAATWFAMASCLLAQVRGYTITTVAGGGNSYPGDGGTATSALLYFPLGVVVDAAGNLYIVDNAGSECFCQISGTIRKVSPSGIISTVAGGGTLTGSFGDGGPATSAALKTPTGIAL